MVICSCREGIQMKEVKNPRKPLIYYYVIVLLAVFLFNALVMPLISNNRIVEATYDEFMTMKIGRAHV